MWLLSVVVDPRICRLSVCVCWVCDCGCQVHIEFTDEQDQIRLEGPPEDVEEAMKMLQELVNDLVCVVITWSYCVPIFVSNLVLLCSYICQ